MTSLASLSLARVWLARLVYDYVGDICRFIRGVADTDYELSTCPCDVWLHWLRHCSVCASCQYMKLEALHCLCRLCMQLGQLWEPKLCKHQFLDVHDVV